MALTAVHAWKPSSSRSVVIDTFVPVPRGGSVSTPPLLNWAPKDPRDVLDYQVDISPALVGDENDVIASVDAVSSPNGPDDLAITSVLADGPRVIVWVSGGMAGRVYNVRLEIAMTSGRRVQRGILLPVVEMANGGQNVAIIEVSSGIQLTDDNGNPVLV